MVFLAATVEHWTRLYADREKSRNAFEAIHMFNVYSHNKELMHSVFVNSMKGWLKSYLLYYSLKEFINFQSSAQKMVMEFFSKK